MSEVRPAAAPRILPRAQALGWLALAALALVAWREGLRYALSEGGGKGIEHILFDAADNPPWLITVVSALLLLSRGRELRERIGPPGSLLAASALLVPGLALLGWARFVGAADLALLGTVAMAVGSAWAALGAGFARGVGVPMALLAFGIPAPGALVNQIVYPLQLFTAEYAAALVGLAGATAIQTADVIRTPSHVFLVVEGCSGLGSMEVLTLLAIAFAWQTRIGLARGFVLALAAPAIAFALNGPRVAALVLWPDSPVWSGHTTQGIVTIALGALCIALLDRWIAWGEPSQPPPSAPAPSAPARLPRGLLAFLAAAAVVTLAVPRFEATTPPELAPLLPVAPPGWVADDQRVDELYLGSVRPQNRLLRRYRLEPGSEMLERWGPEPVTVFAARDDRSLRSSNLLSDKVTLPGRGWRAIKDVPEDLPGRFVARRVDAVSAERRSLSRTIFIGVGSVGEETARAFLALDRSPFRRAGRAHVMRLTTEVAPGPSGMRLARRRLGEALAFLRPTLGPASQQPSVVTLGTGDTPREGASHEWVPPTGYGVLTTRP